MVLQPRAVVVAGVGEIGSAIFQLCRGAYEQVIGEDPRLEPPEPPRHPVAALHVAIPGSLPGFVDIVAGYVGKYEPEVVLINSSTVPGITDQLADRVGADRVVHTQVHGKHKGGRMRRDMLRYPRFVATASDVAFTRAKDVLVSMGHAPESIIRLRSVLAGEITKLLATTFFAHLIAWMQEVERLSDRTGVALEDLMAFTTLDTDDFQIRGKFPGVIGGHCVMPNIEILRTAYPSPLWDFLANSNAMKAAGVCGHDPMSRSSTG